VPAKVALFLG